jgi:hypothetical protein
LRTAGCTEAIIGCWWKDTGGNWVEDNESGARASLLLCVRLELLLQFERA